MSRHASYWRALVAAILLSLVCGVAVAAPTHAAVPAQGDGWQTFVSDDAAYSFDYPAGTTLSSSEDAALRFKIVQAQLPVTDTSDYQGISVMVLENPSNQPLQSFITAKSLLAGSRAPAYTALQVNARPAIKLERDAVIGNLDKYTVLIPGNGVIYRLNLYGGGIGGPIEPSPQTEALFNRIVQSFRVLDVPLQPRAVTSQPSAVQAVPPTTSVFAYPLHSGAGVDYGVPVGNVVGGTRMEWLDYGIRNLDQWGIKCYGVDWTRMLHTGEDWYRLDGSNTAGSPVYAIADGIVARADPGISYPGRVILIWHRLPDGRDIYSMYGHVANVSVVQGQLVSRGQQIATVLNQGYTGRTPGIHPPYDSHLHFEMRYFLDGTNIYVPGTNAYNYNYPGCTYAYPGRGYTYLIPPDDYPYPNAGYVDPTDFIKAHQGTPPPGCQPVELVANGGFEQGLPGTPWTATNSLDRNDPLIYKQRPHTGLWGGWLGNVANYTDVLAQAMAIPANSATLTLTFWAYVQTKEAAGSGKDTMTVLLQAPNGDAIGPALTVTTAATRSKWLKQTATFNLAGTAYPTAMLSFTGRNNATAISSFFIDDVSLIRACP